MINKMDNDITRLLSIFLLISSIAVCSTDSRADTAAGAYIYTPSGETIYSSVGGSGSALWQQFGEDGAFIRGIAKASSEMGILKVNGEIEAKTNSSDLTNASYLGSYAGASFSDGGILEVHDQAFLEKMQSNPYVTPIVNVTIRISVDSFFSVMLPDDSPYGDIRTSGGFNVSFNQWIGDYQRSQYFYSGSYQSKDHWVGYSEINSSSNNFDTAPLNSLDGLYEFTIPMIPFLWFDMQVALLGEATGHDATAYNQAGNPVYFGSFSSVYALNNSLYWGGITSISDSEGNIISDYSFYSTSGFDYNNSYIQNTAAVPEPGALGLSILGLIIVITLRRQSNSAKPGPTTIVIQSPAV